MVGQLEYDSAKKSLRIILAEVNDVEELKNVLSDRPLFDEDGSEAE